MEKLGLVLRAVSYFDESRSTEPIGDLFLVTKESVMVVINMTVFPGKRCFSKITGNCIRLRGTSSAGGDSSSVS